MVFRALSVLVLAALPAVGQTSVVLPPSHASQEGTSSTNVPFGRSTPTRVQCVYDAMSFQGPVTITAVAFRADGGGVLASKVVDAEIRMSTMPGGLLQLSAAFGQNRGGDETVVLPRRILTLPAQTVASTPSPFLPPIALPVPFAYDPSQGALCVEIVVHGQPPGAYSLDLTYACTSPEVAFGPAGCPQPGSVPLRVQSATTQVMWGRPWVVRVLDAQPGAFVILALGSKESGSWAGYVLPQDLVALGAPSCFLSIDIAGTVFGFAAGDGSATFPFVIPNDPSVIGAWVRFQGAAGNPAANALGVVTSQARKVQVCGWEPVGRVWSSGTAASTGVREIGVAPVLRLSVQ